MLPNGSENRIQCGDSQQNIWHLVSGIWSERPSAFVYVNEECGKDNQTDGRKYGIESRLPDFFASILYAAQCQLQWITFILFVPLNEDELR